MQSHWREVHRTCESLCGCRILSEEVYVVANLILMKKSFLQESRCPVLWATLKWPFDVSAIFVLAYHRLKGLREMSSLPRAHRMLQWSWTHLPNQCNQRASWLASEFSSIFSFQRVRPGKDFSWPLSSDLSSLGRRWHSSIWVSYDLRAQHSRSLPSLACHRSAVVAVQVAQISVEVAIHLHPFVVSPSFGACCKNVNRFLCSLLIHRGTWNSLNLAPLQGYRSTRSLMQVISDNRGPNQYYRA